jgi:hypothetical protein
LSELKKYGEFNVNNPQKRYSKRTPEFTRKRLRKLANDYTLPGLSELADAIKPVKGKPGLQSLSEEMGGRVKFIE